jgi:hypothetical protein
MSSFDVTSIIGFCFFAVSEILPLLPVNTNGILHSFIIGFKDSFKNIDHDIELAQKLIQKKPDIANVVNIASTNTVIQDCINDILQNQHLIPHIQALCKNSDLQNVFQNLKNNPILLQNIKSKIDAQSISITIPEITETTTTN